MQDLSRSEEPDNGCLLPWLMHGSFVLLICRFSEESSCHVELLSRAVVEMRNSCLQLDRLQAEGAMSIEEILNQYRNQGQ